MIIGVILWITSNWKILKWNLSDHLITLLKWKYEVWAFFWRAGRPHKRMERDFIDLITFGIKNNYFLSFLWYFMKFFHQLCVFLFRGVSGGIVVLLSSLASFVASTRLIQSRIGAIDSPDQSRQGFEQYNTSEVLEKISRATFRSLVVKKC